MAAARKWLKETPRKAQPWDEDGGKLPGGKVYSPAGFNLFPAATALYRKETYDNYPGVRATLKAFVEEEHFGRTFWVVRKGCTPARPGQEGFVGGSMGDESVILEGVESGENEQALFSTVHGAGRVMSRTKAAGRIRRRKQLDEHGKKVWVEEQIKPGVVDWPAVQARLREQGIVLVGGGADEAPEVYKRLPDVLAAHGETIRVKHTLRPLGVAMAGHDVYDPYKD
jgi:tRNA-splicing ligase RtcB